MEERRWPRELEMKNLWQMKRGQERKIRAQQEEKEHKYIDENSQNLILAIQKENRGLGEYISRVHEKMECPQKDIHLTGSEMLQLSDCLEERRKELLELNKEKCQNSRFPYSTTYILLHRAMYKKAIHQFVGEIARRILGNWPKQENKELYFIAREWKKFDFYREKPEEVVSKYKEICRTFQTHSETIESRAHRRNHLLEVLYLILSSRISTDRNFDVSYGLPIAPHRLKLKNTHM
ncbi:hypothetical protein B9Z55_008611 [Caenorhabditis nigoni]|uniref:Uncharacterized protein n=1 Tax=Caenorhabditis nigoni TaxID=1611254 RepID=A0A2G5UND0_9PELO|nr:hypothetical protein B9Z55_008611 [Caenorhabditis nigoni]